MILKKLRQQRGWSLDKAADKTGVSKAMLGQIERQESSPTISTLWKIASGFDTSFSSFLEDMPDDLHKPVFRPSQVKDIHPADKKIRVAALFPFDKKLNCEIFLIELLPSCEHLSPPHQPGVIEHVIVVEGEMEVLINKKWKTLHKGEGLRFNANQTHGYRNKNKKIACFHDIIHYPIN
jgi:transcriptional regulator with XRE-family HTH domain